MLPISIAIPQETSLKTTKTLAATPTKIAVVANMTSVPIHYHRANANAACATAKSLHDPTVTVTQGSGDVYKDSIRVIIKYIYIHEYKYLHFYSFHVGTVGSPPLSFVRPIIWPILFSRRVWAHCYLYANLQTIISIGWIRIMFMGWMIEVGNG